MKSILIIEDEKDLLEGIKDILYYEGYNVLIANDGLAGIDMAIEHLPDLILSDIMMPGIDGFEVVKRLKKEARTTLIPIILITALSDRNDIRKGMEVGASDYIIKPFTRDNLLMAIEGQLSILNATIDKEDRVDTNEEREINFNLPHEFRTSLNVILGFSSIIKDEAEQHSADSLAEMGKCIFDSSNVLFHVIDKYLTFIDIEFNMAKCRYTWVDNFNTFLEKIVRSVARKNNRLEDLELDLVPCDLEIDKSWIELVISEVMLNAFKFSHQRDTVLVKCMLKTDTLQVMIEDKGIGMSEEDISQINGLEGFNPKLLNQQDIFGLALSKKIVDLHKGKFQIRNNEEDGTTITFSLPIMN